MDTKNYTQVLIDGKVYTLGGSGDESYLQKAVSYVNEKNSAMREVSGLTKQGTDYRMIVTELNIADDYFKAMEWNEGMEHQKNDMEKEAYSLKYELASTQIELEAVLGDLEERQKELNRLSRRTAQLEGELKEARENLQNLRANSSAETKSKARVQIEAVEEIEETVEIEAGIARSASRLEPVSGSAVREASQPETASQTLDAGASARQPTMSASQSEEKRPALSLRVLTPTSEAGRGMAAASTQAATTAIPSTAPSAAPVTTPLTEGMTDEEFARKALQATGKASSHKDGRRQEDYERDVSRGYVGHLLFRGDSSGKVGQNGEGTGRGTGAGRVI